MKKIVIAITITLISLNLNAIQLSPSNISLLIKFSYYVPIITVAKITDKLAGVYDRKNNIIYIDINYNTVTNDKITNTIIHEFTHFLTNGQIPDVNKVYKTKKYGKLNVRIITEIVAVEVTKNIAINYFKLNPSVSPYLEIIGYDYYLKKQQCQTLIDHYTKEVMNIIKDK